VIVTRAFVCAVQPGLGQLLIRPPVKCLNRYFMNCACMHAAVTTAEVMPPYEVIASPAKPVGTSVIIDHHHQQQQQQQPRRPHPSEAVDNVSLTAAAALLEGRPEPPTEVRAARQPGGSVLLQWTAPASRDNVDHYVVEYRAVWHTEPADVGLTQLTSLPSTTTSSSTALSGTHRLRMLA